MSLLIFCIMLNWFPIIFFAKIRVLYDMLRFFNKDYLRLAVLCQLFELLNCCKIVWFVIDDSIWTNNLTDIGVVYMFFDRFNEQSISAIIDGIIMIIINCKKQVRVDGNWNLRSIVCKSIVFPCKAVFITMNYCYGIITGIKQFIRTKKNANMILQDGSRYCWYNCCLGTFLSRELIHYLLYFLWRGRKYGDCFYNVGLGKV